MKSRVIYVDFVRKTVRPNPVEISFKKNLIKSFIEKVMKKLNFNHVPAKTKKQAYNYKHTM
jgi:hypothetical protein